MSDLEEYIKNIKKFVSENNLNDLEKARYIYLDLGKRLNFDLDFCFGSKKQRVNIYKEPLTDQKYEEDFKRKHGICKFMSYLYERISKEVGLQCSSFNTLRPCDELGHIHNVLNFNGHLLRVDLQRDLENIQSNSRTKFFGVAMNSDKMLIDQKVIEHIDRKLNYISDDKYYSDEYLYLMKYHLDNIKDLYSKLDFILDNIDIYKSNDMGYAERIWHHEAILNKLLDKKQRDKIRYGVFYTKNDDVKNYINGFLVLKEGKESIYLYDQKDSNYKKVTYDQYYEMEKEGLKSLFNIAGYERYAKNKKRIDREID